MKNLLFLILSITISFSGCATYIKVKLLKPAELNIGIVKKITIDDFQFRGRWDFNDQSSLNNFTQNQIVHKFFNNNYNSYDPLKAFPGKTVSNVLVKKLSENGSFKVVKSDEIGMNIQNNINKQNLKQNFAIDAIITGNGEYSISDRGQWFEDIIHRNNVIIKNRKYIINRNIGTDVSYQVISTNSGQVIATKNNSTYNSEKAVGYDEEDARRKLKSWYKVVESQVEYLSNLTVKQIAPHYITEEREIKDGKSYLMKNAFEYAKREFWDDAKRDWEDVIRNRDSLDQDKKEDAIFAMYDLGVYYEIKGNFDQAEEYYQMCYERTRKTEYLDNKSRVEKRKSEVNKLRNQNIETKN